MPALKCWRTPAGQFSNRHHVIRPPGGNRIWPLPGYWNEGEDSGIVTRCAPPMLLRCLGGPFVTCGAGSPNLVSLHYRSHFGSLHQARTRH